MTLQLGLSVDTLDRHGSWEADITRAQGSAVNDFPMLADAVSPLSRAFRQGLTRAA